MPLEDFPRDWGFEREQHGLYDQLVDEGQILSPFRGKNFADVFVFAMSLGFRNKSKVPIKRRDSSIPWTALRESEWLIKAVAVADTGGLEVLLEKKRVAKIAEEYAN